MFPDVKNEPYRSSWISLRRIGFMVGYVLIFIACNIEPGTAITPSIFKTESLDDGLSIETEGFKSYLPMVARETLSCASSSFGTMLIDTNPGDWITPASVMIYAHDELGITGLVATGSPSDYVRDQWYGMLPGWTRAFIRGTYDQLEPIPTSAEVFGMQDMYECIGYSPESVHHAQEEALDPLTWVPMAEAVADSAGKCLIYGPAVHDYELMSTPEGEDEPDYTVLGTLISEVAPHTDIWMIQLAKYQRWVDGEHDDNGNPYSMDDFINWAGWWVGQITTANPEAKVWTQLGVGVYDPSQDRCLPPQEPEYILDFRKALIEAGVDGVFVMPSQPCQVSLDPQDHEYYLQSLYTIQQAIELACGH